MDAKSSAEELQQHSSSRKQGQGKLKRLDLICCPGAGQAGIAFAELPWTLPAPSSTETETGLCRASRQQVVLSFSARQASCLFKLPCLCGATAWKEEKFSWQDIWVCFETYRTGNRTFSPVKGLHSAEHITWVFFYRERCFLVLSFLLLFVLNQHVWQSEFKETKHPIKKSTVFCQTPLKGNYGQLQARRARERLPWCTFS